MVLVLRRVCPSAGPIGKLGGGAIAPETKLARQWAYPTGRAPAATPGESAPAACYEKLQEQAVTLTLPQHSEGTLEAILVRS